jgi:hypothetical protein
MFNKETRQMGSKYFWQILLLSVSIKTIRPATTSRLVSVAPSYEKVANPWFIVTNNNFSDSRTAVERNDTSDT